LKQREREENHLKEKQHKAIELKNSKEKERLAQEEKTKKKENKSFYGFNCRRFDRNES